VIDVQPHQLSAILSHVHGIYSPWALLHIHSPEEKGALHKALRVSPGMAIDVRLQKTVISSARYVNACTVLKTCFEDSLLSLRVDVQVSVFKLY